MADPAPLTSAPLRPDPVRSRWRRWDVVRGVLLLLTLLASIVLLVVGERTTSYTELRLQVLAGEVGSVEVTAEGLTANPTGFATAEVHWRDGVLRRTARVVVAASQQSARSAATDAPVITTDVATDLGSLDREVSILPHEGLHEGATMMGWQVPGELALGLAALLVAALVLLARGAEPWRATRWGWAWPMLMVPVLGLPAYLVLAGPGPTRDPGRDARRLTGGWSFLLTVVVLVPLLT